MAVAQFDGGAQSFVGVCGRHPDVGYHYVGMVPGHGGEQRAPVANRLGDLMAAALDQPGQALAEQGRVFGDNHTQGCHRGLRRAAAA
jgi:hypothetical protein